MPNEKPSPDASPHSAPGIPSEIPIPPPLPDSLPVIRSWNRFCRTGNVCDYLTFKSIEGSARHAPDNPRDRPGADGVWFPGQNADPAHF
ncbi:MAG: hypothetical protein SOV73_00050 [Candidatus Faecivivens sp.]|nr:hypothetical protein [Oscillospiraceae bacterium]MDY2711722.1 hypothetical protein [Candidatus Faecivivens sp.]